MFVFERLLCLLIFGCQSVRMVSALVSFLCFLLIQEKKQETFRKVGWLLYCIAFQ